ncbi:conserved hypothetical protein, YceG family [Desulfosporosinus orientis DSM 765]|uniref:Endolytic murein transglycosylase n=2 Tax=Desulfosporosinus orientis TaxID=1563 RepID=G7W5K9_DESOD|nr:conserved hypothetical protein, YceG family [Desulfosporosinus orientis DSM 765]
MKLFLVFLIGGFGLVSWCSWALKPYSSEGTNQKITIAPGTTAGQLAEDLQERRLIRSAFMFKVLARLNKDEFKLYVGDYYLTPQMSPEEMINRLVKDSPLVKSERVTIPEGFTTDQIIDLLVQKGFGTKEDFIKVVSEDNFSYSFLKDAPNGVHRLEGYLSPNTYDFDKKSSPHAIIDLLLRQFEKEITPEVQKQLDTLNFSVSEWVTLASIIEKEAVKAEDRPIISSVFQNRLKIGQPLQSCATIQFILGTPKPKLYDKDLQIPSPYNTYLHQGLPPGPISNPGHASLEAALYPAQTDYLYFVAKKDGYHAFAKTYSEHLKNVKLYQG